MERTNARTLTAATLPEPIDLAIVDVSFISLGLVLGADRWPRSARHRAVRSSRWSSRSSRPAAAGPTTASCATRRSTARSSSASSRPRGASASARARSSPRRSPGPEGNREFLVHLAVRGPAAREIGERIAEVTAAVTVKRIGFAYNPTIEAAVELSARAAGWCQVRGIDHWQAQSGDQDALVRELRDDRCPRRARWRRHVPARGPGGRRGRRPDPRHQPRQGRLPVEGRGRRARRRSWPRSPTGGSRSTSGWRSRAGSCATASRSTTVRHFALNDIVVARGSLARVCRLDVAIDDTHLATFIADGLVVASPTGSTGYSFSAGGPILDPVSRNLVVTPIAAYLSAIRSVVVSPQQTVRCTVVDAYEALVSVDGREDIPVAGRRRRRGPGRRAADPARSSRRAPSRSGTCSATRSRCCRRDATARDAGPPARADGRATSRSSTGCA